MANYEEFVHSSSPQLFGDTTSTPTAHPSSSPHPFFENIQVHKDEEESLFMPPENPKDAPLEPPTFDRSTFEAFIGSHVSDEVLHTIRKKCQDDLEKAVNMYLDGTWKSKPTLLVAQKPITQQLAARPASSTNPQPYSPATMPHSRYVGAFGAEGWATRSGSSILKHGDTVLIERQKIQAAQPASARGRAKLGTQIVARPSQVGKQRVDVIVRFCSNTGSEIGRLSKETSSWVSTLIDQKVCQFEGTCVFAPERLRTNDTVFLQIRCYLLRSGFSDRGFQLPKKDSVRTSFFESQESEEEKVLRLRQVALVTLFQEINLMPTRVNATAEKHKRKGLLAAVEKDEVRGSVSSPQSEEAEDGEELEANQIDELYRKAQSFDFNTPQEEPPSTFAMTLRPYQKQSLHWMMAKEKCDKDDEREASMHPLWEEYAWPTKDADDKDVSTQGTKHFYINPYSGDASLEFPIQKQNCRGGILADEMGLGKTIQILSLVHSHRSAVAKEARDVGSTSRLPRFPVKTGSVLSAPCTTLVVAPMSLLAQWQSEAENASVEGTMKTLVYYGSDKNINLQSLCCEANASSAPDVIITSYGVVLSEFTQIASKKSERDGHIGLFSLKFWRVVLDEAHYIKNRNSKTAKACYQLAAFHRWVLTGTPIVNRLEDLFSLIRFLRVEPWNNFSFWRTFITVPFESKDFVRALDVVQTVLEPLVMRRTKDMKTPDGMPLVPLPPKHVEVVPIELSKSERDVYDYIYLRVRQSFKSNVEAGTVMKSYTTIFSQILRLRQSCDHPFLVRNQDVVADEEQANAQADAAAGLADDMDLHSLIDRFTAVTEDGGTTKFGAHILKQIRDEMQMECPFCMEEPMQDQTVTGCWHSACRDCLLTYIEKKNEQGELAKCVNCREPINMRDLFEVVRHDEESERPKISLQRFGVNNSSAKVVQLIKHLRDLRREHPRMRSVVFSQFTSFLSLLQPALARAGIEFVRLDGTMAQKTRAAVLSDFKSSHKFMVLLISLKAGGVGLNLTCAERVYMMDPWWSFAVEAQAIDRVHRMGQEKEVKVYRFIVKDSVEERMLKVQERKKFIASSLGMMSEEDRRVQTMEDMKELLSLSDDTAA